MSLKEENKINVAILNKMQKISKVVSFILFELKKKIENWDVFNGKELETIAKNIMDKEKVFSSSYLYNDFPSYICVSVSNKKESELTHGIPTEIPFEKGDIVSVDVACYLIDEKNDRFHADAALTAIIKEKDNIEKNNLINTTKNCLDYVISQIIPNLTTVSDIGKMIQDYTKKKIILL